MYRTERMIRLPALVPPVPIIIPKLSQYGSASRGSPFRTGGSRTRPRIFPALNQQGAKANSNIHSCTLISFVARSSVQPTVRQSIVKDFEGLRWSDAAFDRDKSWRKSRTGCTIETKGLLLARDVFQVTLPKSQSSTLFKASGSSS